MKKIIFLFLFITSLLFAEEILSLEDSIRIAIDNNPKIKISQARIDQAYYQKEIAKTNFLPKISSSFNYTYLGKNRPISFNPLFPSFKVTDDNLYTVSFKVTQPIFTGWKIETAYQVGKESFEKTKIDYETEIQNLVLDVKKAYFNVLKAQRLLETSLRYRESLQNHLKDAKRMFEMGLVTKLDILKTEVALKDAETKITESENFLNLAKSNFNFVLNRPVDHNFIIQDMLEQQEVENDYQWWLTTAMKQRNEIKSFEKVLSIYDKNIKIEKSNLYPQMYFFFNYNFEKGTQTSREDWNDNWNTGILLSYDIWNWGETQNKIKKAEKSKQEIEKQFELVKNSIEIEVKNAYLNFLSAKKKIEQAKKQIESAEENLRVARLLFNEGMATTTDVIDANTALIQANNNFFNYLYEYQISCAELEKA
ncbi:MAG: TolC family protein, partial [Candidatus Ratteibacteria bacterium]